LKSLVFPGILAIVFSATAAPTEQGQLDGNITLFTVMAAIGAAGYSADLASPNNSPLRDQVRSEILRKNPPCLEALKQFFEKHRKRGEGADTAELSQYISFALSVKGPPDFKFGQRDVDVPPDVVPLKSLSGLLAQFYKEAGVEDMWQRAQPAYDHEIDRVHKAAADARLYVDSYLRHVASGLDRSHFQIYVEPLAAPNQVQARSYGNEFTVVVTPAPEPRAFDIRHEYLHYLLDPLSTLQQDVLERKKLLNQEAMRAPALEQPFKEDFLLLTTECLIKAIEARLDNRPERVQQDLKQGYILTPYFAEALPAYEKQLQPMKDYYADMVMAIDLTKEATRLENLDFDKQAAAPAVVKSTAPPPAPPAPLTGAAKTLDEADRLWDARNQGAATVENAKKMYLQVLSEAGEPPVHAAAYYGLARIAAVQKDPETAEQFFQKTLELQPEPQVKAWALVYLGRLSLAADDRDQAVKDFQEALKVDGASEAARKAATEGLQVNPKR
jgi:tetratricopeptide (TPR) repeat protein